MDSPSGSRIAVWQTASDGLNWLNELAKAGKIISLGGVGYPCRYTGLTEHIVPRIIDTPPGAWAVWRRDECDGVTEKWEGRTVIDVALAKQCRTEEWLLVEAWDES